MGSAEFQSLSTINFSSVKARTRSVEEQCQIPVHTYHNYARSAYLNTDLAACI